MCVGRAGGAVCVLRDAATRDMCERSARGTQTTTCVRGVSTHMHAKVIDALRLQNRECVKGIPIYRLSHMMKN